MDEPIRPRTKEELEKLFTVERPELTWDMMMYCNTADDELHDLLFDAPGG